MRHDLTTIHRVIDRLEHLGASCWLFGGWAEELRGLCRPRAHRDIDALYVAEGFALIDDRLRRRDLSEIRGKRFPHKRAFEFEGVMVELFLLQRDRIGFFTDFWGRERFRWPSDVVSSVGGLPTASAAALRAYTREHPTLHASTPTDIPASGSRDRRRRPSS